ncbi:DNA repair protein [archaeon]|nr:MAG: DNA repair protein [archaeon]
MIQLQKVTEITISYRPKRSSTTIRTSIVSSADAASYLLGGFDQDTIGLQEQFVIVYLNAAGIPIGLYRASKGGITGTVVDIRLILSVALKVLATSMIIAHNHPSGQLKPSRSDEELTRKLKESAKLMDIRLLDHLIFAPDSSFFSFADEGLI